MHRIEIQFVCCRHVETQKRFAQKKKKKKIVDSVVTLKRTQAEILDAFLLLGTPNLVLKNFAVYLFFLSKYVFSAMTIRQMAISLNVRRT